MMKPDLALMGMPTSGVDALQRPLPQANAKTTEAAQQFEQIFLRKMLGSLMKTAKLAPESQMAGGEMYDSLVVEALASSLSEGGGIGIATVIEQRLAAQTAPAPVSPGVTPASSETEFRELSSSAVSVADDPAPGHVTLSDKSSSISSESRLSGLEVAPGDLLTPRRIR